MHEAHFICKQQNPGPSEIRRSVLSKSMLVKILTLLRDEEAVPPEHMSRALLRAECADRGVGVSGSRRDLMKRLVIARHAKVPSAFVHVNNNAHPLTAKGMGVIERDRPVVPVIRYSRLPSHKAILIAEDNLDMCEGLDDGARENVLELREQYARAACALTVPFRMLGDLKECMATETGTTWWESWVILRDGTPVIKSPQGDLEQEATPTRVTDAGGRFLLFQEEYHHDRRCAAIIDPSDRSAQWSLACATSTQKGAGTDEMHFEFGHLENENSIITEAIKQKEAEQKIEWAKAASNGSIVEIPCVTSTKFTKLSASDWNPDVIEQKYAPISETLKYGHSSFGDAVATANENHDDSDSGFAHLDTIVCLLRDALEPKDKDTNTAPEYGPIPKLRCTPIRTAIQEFELGIDQARAFRCMCASFLYSLAKRYEIPGELLSTMEEDFKCLPKDKQLIMGMFGEGGTGKSKVINAFQEFVQRWGSPESLCVTATTGVAACLISGITWHKASGHASFIRGTKTIKPVLQKDWATITVMVIDEVSMMSARNLHHLDQWLQKLKKRPGVLFGGVHMVRAAYVSHNEMS